MIPHHAVAVYLPEYVAELLGGGAPDQSFPLVARHLVSCPQCAADLGELLALARAAYADQDPLPPSYPTPDLAALAPPAPGAPTPGPATPDPAAPPAPGAPTPGPATPDPAAPPAPGAPTPGLWRHADQGWRVVELSPALLALGRPSALVGLARTEDLLFDLRVPRETSDDPELRLEVFGEGAGATVRVRISVDLPDLDPFESAGVEVTLMSAQAGEWRAVTGAVGTVSVAGIPRATLEGASIAVRAARST